MATRTRRSRLPRRRMFWVRITNFTSILADGGGAVGERFNALAQFESEYGADLFGFTVTRIRGNIAVAHNSNATAQERREFSFGIRLASQSVTISPTAEDLPAVNPHEDWMFTLTDPMQFTRTDRVSEYRYALDIKGQRRLDELGESLFVYTGFSQLTLPDIRTENSQIGVELNILCKRP